jgi:hypothetical protein
MGIMKYELSLKKFEPSKAFNKLLNRYKAKIKRKLHNFSDDVTELTIIIKQHEKNHFYSGRFTLLLPVKSLQATTGGNTAETVLAEGFEKILKTFEVYKGKHFKGSSKYGHHETIREPETVVIKEISS